MKILLHLFLLMVFHQMAYAQVRDTVPLPQEKIPVLTDTIQYNDTTIVETPAGEDTVIKKKRCTRHGRLQFGRQSFRDGGRSIIKNTGRSRSYIRRSAYRFICFSTTRNGITGQGTHFQSSRTEGITIQTAWRWFIPSSERW